MIGNRALTDKEVQKIVDVLPELRDKVLFLLGCKSGFRVSEILSLKVSDMMQYGSIRPEVIVHKRNTKTQLESRSTPLSKDVIFALEKYISTLPANQEWLFRSKKGGQLSRIQAWRRIKEAVQVLQLSGKIATHSMRKTFAEKAWKASKHDLVALADMLGHKNVNSARSYIASDKKKNEQRIVRMNSKTFVEI